MIRIRLNGRLGNQLFIYAFARMCAEKYNQVVCIYDRKKEQDSMWHSHLDRYILNPKVKFSSEKEILRLGFKQSILYKYHWLKTRKATPRERYVFQKNMFNFFVSNGLLLMTDGYFELPESVPQDLYCEGYFQSADFFNDIREDLIREFTVIQEYTQEEKDVISKIDNCEAVCLTVRLGDFIGNSTHQVCTRDYYLKAMELMKNKYPNCKFFAFSDEIDKLKELIDFKYPVYFDSGKSSDVISLDIMSHCKHFILSNSSFSWWAQYLSKNNNKTVISPSKWYAKDVPCFCMDDSWVKIDC